MGKGRGGMGKRRYTWSSSRCEKQGVRLRGEKLNSEEDMELNGLNDGEQKGTRNKTYDIRNWGRGRAL